MNCSSAKACYTAQQAKRKAQSASRRYSQAMTAYRCKDCGAWHIGHPAGLKAPIPLIARKNRVHPPKDYGNPNFRKCPFCKEYDSPERMKHNPSSRYYYHAACKQEYRKARSAQA